MFSENGILACFIILRIIVTGKREIDRSFINIMQIKIRKEIFLKDESYFFLKMKREETRT